MPRNTQSADDLIALLRGAAAEASTLMKALAWHPALDVTDRAALFGAVIAAEAAIGAADNRPRRKRTVRSLAAKLDAS